MCVCKCISEQLTYSNNMRHPVRVLNPNETYNQWCPVFPNRTPGRQPSISHGCKVAGSTFFFSKFQRRLRTAHQNWIRRSICGFWCLRQICDHCTWCNILLLLLFVCFLFFVPVTHKSESGSIWLKHPSPSQADRWYTCERRLLQLACRSLCIPSFHRCYLSIGKYHGNSRARLPAPLWRRRTAPAEL